MATEQATTPYAEDNNRKGATRGEAIFGDKEARLLVDIAPEGQSIVDEFEARASSKEALSRAAAIAALDEVAARGNWDQARVDDYLRQNIDHKHPVSK